MTKEEHQAEVRRLLNLADTTVGAKRVALYNLISSKIAGLHSFTVAELIAYEYLHPAIKIDWDQVNA